MFPTHHDNLSTSSTTWASGGNIRALRALLGSRAVQRKQPRPREHAAINVEPPPVWHGIEDRFAGSAEVGGRLIEGTFTSSREGGGAVSLVENIELPSDGHVLVLEPFRPSAGSDSRGGALDPRAVQTTKDWDNIIEGYTVTREEMDIPSRQIEGGESRHPRPRPSSLGARPEQDSLINWYPSRPASAEASVSLISPRTSKKIRRLPTPGQIEEDTLQVFTFCGDSTL